MRKKTDYILLVLLFLMTAVFVVAVWKLAGIYAEYRQGTKVYEKLQGYAKEPDQEDDGSNDRKQEDTDYLEIDFKGLKTVNQDVIAWIHIPALDISYPVVQGRDNSYYLHHLFDKKENKNGSIFVDWHNQPNFTDRNTIIYGHNMKNGSMFGKLKQYRDKKIYRKYPYFYIYVPGEILEYQIISCYAGRNKSIGYTYSFPKAEDFQKFLSKIQSYAGYGTDTEVKDSDYIVTLSTCVSSNRNYRYLVHGKLVQKIQSKGK